MLTKLENDSLSSNILSTLLIITLGQLLRETKAHPKEKQVLRSDNNKN